MELGVEDLLRAQRIVLTNALRGAVDASLDPAGRRMLTRGRRGHAADPGLHRSGAGGGADQRAG
jgi:hypothetical protein